MLLVSPVWRVEAEPLLALRSSPAPASRPLLCRPRDRRLAPSRGRWLCSDTPTSEWRRCENWPSTPSWSSARRGHAEKGKASISPCLLGLCHGCWLDMVYLVALLLSCIVGAVVGRWWFVVAFGCGVGLWVGISTDVDEVPAWFLGGVYGALALAGGTLGVLVRALIGQRRARAARGR
jgi:hypothetical protein